MSLPPLRRAGGDEMNTTSPDTGSGPRGSVSLRAAATWFIDRTTLPRHGDTVRFGQDFARCVAELIPQVEYLAGQRDTDDVPARAALAEVGEARCRLDEPEAVGLAGEVERVKQLARSVCALYGHYDTLTQARLCLACRLPIEDGEDSRPYDRAGPSGDAGRNGSVHATCMHMARRTGG
ncbi:DUF6415 family natural product biosynthesis protein [Streptomyces hirsutus]|uniref:DUF6415 family natural product biosynthesis protein n=1 Tax=Streptomyces hirsutus TaxID=35620 RepID=UPI0033E7B63F